MGEAAVVSIFLIWESSAEDLHCDMARQAREQGCRTTGSEESRCSKHRGGSGQVPAWLLRQRRNRWQHQGRSGTILSHAPMSEGCSRIMLSHARITELEGWTFFARSAPCLAG